MVKRIFLFLSVNILVMLTISFTLSLLGVRGYLTAQGIDYGALMVFCLVWGFAGAFISLALSRIMAKFMMGVQVIDPQSASGTERQLHMMVQRLVQKQGIPMPQVGIYESPEVNAFATGPTKSRALVAVSTGLLHQMDDAAVEGVIGHEIAHIANGDMVTMALLQGVINAFVMFFARIAAFALSQAMSGDREERGNGSPWVYYLSQFLFEIVFSLLGAIVVAWFSRQREFRADKGGAKLAGREKMVHALQTLKSRFEGQVDTSHPAVAAFKINGAKGWMNLFATHPDLETRIARLKTAV